MNPVKMLVTYRPKAGAEDALLSLVRNHWPALQKAGLSTNEPSTIYRAVDKRSGAVSFVEMFSWKDQDASTKAHHHPDVQAVWGPMMPILEGMELAAIEPVS